MRALILLLLAASSAFPQRVASVRSGTLYYPDRGIRADGVELRISGEGRLPQLENGQTVETGDANAEFLMGPDSVMWISRGSRIRFDDTTVADARVEILEGSVMVENKSANKERVLTIVSGGHAVQVSEEGVYRVDHQPWRARVYEGELWLGGVDSKTSRGQQWTADGTGAFNRDERDEFHYWSAYRSLILAKDSGKLRGWRTGEKPWGPTARTSGFGVELPFRDTAAYIKYVAASEAGMVYAITGAINISSRSPQNMRVPLAIGQGNVLNTTRGRAEVFLGIGVAGRVERGALLRVLDSSPIAPAVRLEQGRLIIEIGESGEAPPVRVEMGGSALEIRKRGVYEFDAAQSSVWVYDGEAQARVGDRVLRVRSGEHLSVPDSQPRAAKIEKFDKRRTNPLLAWSASRSFELYVQQAGFMTHWEPQTLRGEARHKVFGKRHDSRVPYRRRPSPPISLAEHGPA